jgi:hypothetical protein
MEPAFTPNKVAVTTVMGLLLLVKILFLKGAKIVVVLDRLIIRLGLFYSNSCDTGEVSSHI